MDDGRFSAGLVVGSLAALVGAKWWLSRSPTGARSVADELAAFRAMSKEDRVNRLLDLSPAVAAGDAKTRRRFWRQLQMGSDAELEEIFLSIRPRGSATARKREIEASLSKDELVRRILTVSSVPRRKRGWYRKRLSTFSERALRDVYREVIAERERAA